MRIDSTRGSASPRARRAKARSRASRRKRRSRRPPAAARRSPAAGRGRSASIMPSPTSALAHPVEQPAPVRLVHQDDRHAAALAGLHQRQRLDQLVERAVAAGQHDERGRSLHEHHLAREEMLEAQADVLVAVGGLLVGSSMLRPTPSAAPAKAPLLAASIMPGPPPEITREAGVGQQARDVLGELVVRMPGVTRALPNTDTAGWMPPGARSPRRTLP